MNKIRKLNTVIWGSEVVYCPLCKSLIYADEKLRVCEHLVYCKSMSDSKDAPEYDKYGYFDKMKEKDKLDQVRYLDANLSDDYLHICLTSPPPISKSSHYIFFINRKIN